MRAALATLLVLATLGASATAQNMPDPAQMNGMPLPAPELPAGSVTVRVVRERMGNNVPGQTVTLSGAGAARTATTDAQGRAQFDDLPFGTSVRAEVIVDGETISSREFPVPPSGGTRVALIAGVSAAQAREKAAADAAAKEPARPGVVSFGGETRIILEFQDDNLQVFYILEVLNGARTPVDTGAPLIMPFPAGATNAATLDGSSPLARVEGNNLRITGPFPPGVTSVQVGYRMPWRGDQVRIEQPFPAALDQTFVAVEKIGALSLTSPQLTSQQEANAGGTPFIMATGGRVNPGGTLTFDIAGLPNRSRVLSDTGLAVAVFTLLVGAWAAWKGSTTQATRESQLRAKREKLFGELIALEQQQARRASPTFASRRQSLMAQLERLTSELDGGLATARGTGATRSPGQASAS